MSENQFKSKALLGQVFRLANYLPPRARGAFHWKLFCTPIMHQRRAEQLLFLKKGKPFTVPSGKERQIRGWVYGRRGPTVVLCHGWQGSAASWYVLVPRLVQSGFRAVVFDAPGHHARPRRSSLPDFCEALENIVETFGADALVGHSFGAMTVARVTQQLPDLSAVILYSSPDRLVDLARGFCRKVWMSTQAEEAFFETLRLNNPSTLESESVLRYLEKLPTPVLLLHDEEDDVIPFSNSQSISALEHCRLTLTKGLGHRQIIRDQHLAEQVCDFLLEHWNAQY